MKAAVRGVGRIRGRAIAAAVVTVVALSACTVSTRWDDPNTPRASSAANGSIAWRDCRSDAQKLSRDTLPASLSYSCGTVTVPQDWLTAKDGKASDGKTFDIALVRIRSRNQHDRIGSLLTDPGGPGGSGVEFAVNFAGHVPTVLQRFDFVGFDPRGVGQSNPVKCISDADMDGYFGAEPDPRTDTGYAQVVALNRKLGADCGARYGDSLRLYGTEQAARDMDAIRAALGDDKLSYLGFSYGTLLGAVYAELFGKKIRAMVLDGAVDPQQQPIAAAESQAKGFERAFDDFAAWCRQQDTDTCPIKADPQAAMLAALESGRTHPVTGPDGRSATAGWVLYAAVRAMYGKDAWPYLAKAINDLRNGNADWTFRLADDYASRDDSGHYTNLFDSNIAVNCTDSDQYPSQAAIRSLQSQWRAKYPVFGGPMAIGLLTCALWPAKTDPYPIGPAAGAPPIVVVGTTGDPATPYEQTKKLADLLGTGTVLTWQGEGHTAYPSTPCITNAVNGYLINLKPPGEGTTCPAS